MTSQAKRFGFWGYTFPGQLGNLCFVVFLACVALFVLYAAFDLNVFDPECFKSRDERIPELGTRRVVDEAGVLTQEEIDAITRRIDAYEAASGAQMAVLLVKSLHGDAVEDFSLAVAEKWKIGWKGEDNGVLLFLAIDDHRNRLEIGYGLEGIISDARAGDILRGMTRFLRSEQYAQAISYAVGCVSAIVLHENAPDAPDDDALEDEETGSGSRHYAASDVPMERLVLVILIAIVFMVIGTIVSYALIHPDAKPSFGMIAMLFIGKILLEVLKGMFRGGGRGGGGGGGGRSRSGGGGGGFGGGGASGRW